MVCANKDAYYVREFDALRKKLGKSIVSGMYQTPLEYELQGVAAIPAETPVAIAGDDTDCERPILRR